MPYGVVGITRIDFGACRTDAPRANSKIPLVVVLRESETPIGYCGLFWFDDINGQPEIELGYRLAKKYWGRGLATEAGTAARSVAIDELGFNRLISLIDPDNRRSIRVAEKLGMVYTDDVMLPGYSHPDRIY